MVFRILIVEDDPMVAEVNHAFLAEVQGFELVGIAHTGTEALRMIKELKPHLLLLDLFPPDISGTDLLKQARAELSDLDAIMLTAAKEAPLVQDCIKLGVRDYLVKPYFKEQFHRALENYKEYYRTTHQSSGELSQEQIDRLLSKENPKGEERRGGHPPKKRKLSGEVPKGLSPKTLEIILEILEEEADISAEEVAKMIGVSVVTARRYLTYLFEEKIVDFMLSYGRHGRPMHRYFLPR